MQADLVNAVGKYSLDSGNTDIEGIVAVMQRLSVGVKAGKAEEDLCDALASLSVVPGRQ